MPIVTLSWNKMFKPPRILVGAISERNTGTACHTLSILQIIRDIIYEEIQQIHLALLSLHMP